MEDNKKWVGTWSCSMQLTEPENLPPEPGLNGNTIRQIIKTTIPGNSLRLKISNLYGNDKLEISKVIISKYDGNGRIDLNSSRVLTFNENESVQLPDGQSIYTDKIDYPLTALCDIAITISFKNVPDDITGHPGSRTTSYIIEGDNTELEMFDSPVEVDHWYFIDSIDVYTDKSYNSVVVLGDSIVDGRGSEHNENNRWTDVLAKRLIENKETSKVSVLNLGIGGNKIIQGGLGPTAIERFERDVLERNSVKWLIILEGVNDIGESNSLEVVDNLINAYKEFIKKAHTKGIVIYGITILPFGGSQYDTVEHELSRQKVNEWIRESGEFDSVIDLDRVVSDANDKSKLLDIYDSGDRLHLSVEGYKRMGEEIDLNLFLDPKN